MMRILIYVGLLCSVTLSFSQKKKRQDTSNYIVQSNRVEFDMGSEDYDFHVIEGQENGMLVAVQTSDALADGELWVFHYLDTALNVVWSKNFPVPYTSTFTGYDYYSGKYYLMFNISEFGNEEFLIYEIDAESGLYLTFEISTVFPIVLTHFEVINQSLILGGYTNSRPVLLTYNLVERTPKVVPGFYENNSLLLDLIIDDEAQIFTVLTTERQDNRKNSVRVKTFTSSGDLIQENRINPGERNNLIDGTATTFLGGFQYVAGTYSKNASQYSRGLYLAKFINGRQQFVEFHNYADLDNFFGFMGKRREKRMKEKIERKKEKGRKLKFSYRLMVHDIIKRGDEFVMIAEAYYPSYNSYAGSPYGGIGSAQNFTSGFTGYRYTHAIVVAFDKNGDIKWDNSFEIEDILTFSLQKFVQVSVYDDKIVLMYMEGNTIRSKVVEENAIVEGKTFNPVRLSYNSDEIKSKNPQVEGLKKWYGNTYYAFGEQRIKNESGSVIKVYRKIFYINKVTYDLESKL
ncbi:MAG: hypothetical protein RIA69_13995 [Cyclobacteriaceae bacterium]